MNTEEQIERFRREKLPEYMELAKKPIEKVVKEVLYTCNMKQCPKCGEWLPITEFYKGKYICKKCYKIQAIRKNNERD